MPADVAPPGRSGPRAGPPVTVVLPGEAAAVRATILSLLRSPPLCTLTAELRGNAEIVLAEVLNNIVEHAYAAGPGRIELTLRQDGDGLRCTIADEGCPMPGGAPPDGRLPAADPDDLPEGGFGWHMIRTLTRDLAYRRDGGRNLLSFRLVP